MAKRWFNNEAERQDSAQVERYCDLLKMAQGKAQQKGNDDAGRLITWEEFQERYRS